VPQYTNLNHASNWSAVRLGSRTRIGAQLSPAQRGVGSGHSILRDSHINLSASQIAIEHGASAGRACRDHPARTKKATMPRKTQESSGSPQLFRQYLPWKEEQGWRAGSLPFRRVTST